MGSSGGPAALVEKLERASVVDGVARLAARNVRGVMSVSPVLKEVLSGTRAGHAAHPPLTDVVIGSLVSASVLDVIGGEGGDAAARRLILVALAAYGPTALAGAGDWADSEAADGRVRRVGIIHAAANATAMSLYVASLAARWRGDRRRGRLLGFAGAGVLSGAGYLGGHLSYVRGVGVNQTAFDAGPREWTPAVGDTGVVEGQSARVIADQTPVLLVLRQGRLHALHDRCSHRGCSLAAGQIDDAGVTCGCHGSRFSLRDGSVLRGPATAPQPVLDVREHDGRLEVRLQRY